MYKSINKKLLMHMLLRRRWRR